MFFDHSFVVLVLFFLFAIPFAHAVCPICFGNVEGCGNSDAAHCPMTTTTSSNTAAIAAATVGTLSIAAILPLKVMRAFPRRVLDTLAAMSAAPKATTFDCSGKAVAAIFKAVVNGHVSPEDANIELQAQLLDATGDDASQTVSGVPGPLLVT